MKALLRKIRQILRDRKTRRIFTRFVSTVAAIVVFVTTYALVLPAITMEAEAQCGLEAHQHSDECFEEVLVCDLPESQGHSHDESCYAVSSALVCEIEEHEHSEESGCYDENGDLICEVPEHIHSEESGCFEEIRELICGISESEGHQHDSSCYEKVLTCGKEAHTHSTACYTSSSTGAAGSMEAAAVASTASAAAASTESAAAADTENEAAGATEESVDDTSTDPAGANMSAEGDTAPTGTTGTVADSNGYVPVLDALDFYTLLNKNTGIYYSRPADPADANGISAADDTVETDDGNSADASTATAENPAEAAWNRIDKDTTLTESDTLRLYLAYTIPAGSLNSTNPTTRYRLPENITLTDEQVETINGTANGIASQYINLDTLEILDYEKYQETLGLEAVEGTRTPSDDLNEYLARNDGQEFISATVKVENVFDEGTGEYLGQDLVFTFTPYSILKNRHEYDEDGQPTKAGEELRGWVSLDVTTDQIGWTSAGDGDDAGETEGSVEKTADIVFVEKDRELGIDKISTELKLVEKTSAEEARADKAEDADAADTADSDTDEAAEENKEETGDVDSRDEEKEAEEETAAKPAVSYPSITFDDSITVSAGSLSTDTESITGDSGLAAKTEITVHVEADEDTFPEGTTMRLAAVTDDQMAAVTEAVEGAMAEAADAQGTSSRTQGFHAVDISFLNADGIEIEPLKPIRVSMTSEAIKRAVEDESTAPVVVHVDETVDVSKSAATVDNNHTVIGETVEGNTEVVADTLTFEAGSFSVYAIVYTVDFHWNVDGKGYEYSIQGGSAITLSELLPLVNIVKDDPETGIDEVKSFLEDVEKVQFSAPELVWVEKVEEDTTIGDIEDLYKFVVQYSDDITDEQREEYRDKTVSAGDWALISVQPFDSEEVLSVTMKNGERFIVRVTDAQEITNSESSEIDVNKSYLICYETGEGNAKKYYLLKNDGSVDVCTKNGGTYYINGVRQSSSITSISDLFESLNSTYFWSFHYIFTEKDVASTLNNNYYLIRPIDLRSKTLTLNNAGESIVQLGNNNTAVIPVNDDNGSFAGFIFQGYHNVGTEDEPRFIHLGFDGSAFTGMDGDSSIIHVYEMDTLPSYDYSVSTHKLYGYDYSQGPRGSVSVQGILADTVTETNPNDDNDTTVYSFDVYNCTSTAEKKNGAVITADCVRKTSTVSGADRRDNKWLFDHLELNGVELPESAYSVVEKDYKNRPLKVQINTDSLDIPFNGSNLVAFFRQNPDYKVPDSEKQPTSFEDMTEWFNRLTDPDREIPFDGSATDKTAEVYDYENRIYRVDIKTKADYETFSGDIDIGFSLDVSNSMKFPASLKYATYGGNTLDEFSIYSLNDNTSSLDTNRRFNNPYYIIADKNQTSTVLKLYYEPNNFRVYNDNQWKNYNSGWYVQDAAFEEHAFSGTNPRFNRIGKTKFKPSWTSESYYWLNSGDSSSTTYPIYDHGDENSYDRFHYLKECFTGASGDLETIMETLRIAGDESPDVFMAYNTFCKTKKSTSTGTMNASDLKPGETNAFFEAEETTVEFKNDADGGTRPDLAFADTLKWNWRSPNKYLILITDGAPQGGDNTSYDGTTTGSNNSDRVDWADAAAADLKKGKDGVVGFNTATGDNDDIKIISIGLGMKEVEEGRKLLYRIADIDPKSGDRMFYLVDDAADLRNVLRQIIRTLMEEASVNTDITDTVGEAFYLVDKNTGLPLSKGDMLDINGNITTDPDEAAGIVQEDGRTVKWIDQSVDGSNGWHGTIYVKAKEDLIGGNAVKTNEEARIEADSYTVSGITYDFVENQYDHRLKLTIPFEESPRVNVNELTFPNTKTEWTVYLGTVVDPAKQIRQLYESITVEEVVNVDGDENGRLHYLLKPTHPDDISDERDDPGRQDDRLGTADTFLLAPVILDRIKNDPYSSNELKSRYLDGDNLNWTNFLADILETGGVTVPYHPYGIEGEDSNLVITLEKRIKGNEESDLLNHSPHVTTETGIKETEMVAGKEVVTKPAVEEYVLTVRYNPDYKHVLPKGQGGDNAYNFHTGTYGSTYQGHSAGRETSSNTHVINVYSVPLDVYKTNENDGPLQGATFKLYVEDAENGVSVPGLHEPAQEESGNTGNDSSSGKYTEVASGTSGTDGIAHLLGEDDTPFGLVKGKTYYLLEYEAPSNYTKVNTVWAVEVQTEIGKFTSLDGTTIYSRAGTTSGGTGVTDNMYPFNWDQGARIVLNGKQPADVIVKGEEEGQTDTITNGSFVSYSEVISFRHTVQNLGGDIDITVQKTWDDEDDPNRPSSVTVQLYRVGEKDHQWSAGKVIPCTCTAAGVEEYICSVCGKKDTHVINAAGHISGTAHRENETEATCATPGGYDTVVRCKVCNAVITSEHTTIAALGHIWGEWKVTTPAQPGVAGEETRVCQRDPSHIETRPIAPLPNETTITYTTYRDWYGRGWHEDDVTTSTRYQIGSRIRLSWSSRNSYNVTLYINGTERNPRYVTYNYENGYALTGETQQVTRTSTGSYYNRTYNYEVTVTVTDGMTLFLKSDTWDYYPPNNITITPVRSVQNSASRLSTMRSKETMLSSLPALEERTSLKDRTELLRGDSDIKTAASVAMTAEELQSFLSNLKSKEEATCSETEGSTHIYKECVGEYTIEGDDWTRNIPDLPKYNEYGKEYAYYVLETVPSTGYEITYQGQDSGLNSTNGSLEIINKLSKGALLITKSVQYNHQSATSNDEKMLLNGTYQFTVKKDGIEIAGSPFSITVSNGVSNSVLIPDLEAGDYTVAETNSGDLTLDSSSGGSSVLNNIVTVTVTAGKTTEEMLLDTAKASFTNNYTEYGIEILKVDVENSRTKLGGARFNLYAAEDVDTSTWAEPDTNRRLNSSDIVSSSNQATLGEAHLGKLTPGTYYLFETKAPDGYNSLESPIQIIVSDGHISWTQGTHQETRDSSRSGDIVGNTAAFNVTNTAGFELPATGGPGTTLIYLLGFMLTGFAGAGLVMRKRRRDAA